MKKRVMCVRTSLVREESVLYEGADGNRRAASGRNEKKRRWVMNKARRNKLGEAFDLVNSAKEILKGVREEEQEAYDNLPESFQNGSKGEDMQNYMEMIEEAANYLDDANSVIEQI